MTTIVMGLDLGSLATGYAIMEGYKNVLVSGTIKPRRKQHFDKRCFDVASAVANLIKEYPAIDQVYIEDIFFAQNHQTVVKLGQVRGAVSSTIVGLLGIVPTYYPPSIVKKTVSVSGGQSSKSDVQQTVRLITGVDAKSKDESDAIAVAMTGISLGPLKK